MRDKGIPGENKGREEKVGNGICKKPEYQKFQGDIWYTLFINGC